MTTTSSPSAANRERIERLWSYLEADPGNINLLRDIAREGLQVSAPEDTLRAADRLRELKAASADVEAAALHALTKLSRTEEACSRAESAHKAWPEDEGVRLEFARALLNVRRFHDAAGMSSQDAFTDRSLAQMAGEIRLQALWHMGQLEVAADEGAELMRQWPENARILATCAAVFYDLGRSGEALQAAQRAYALSPTHAYAALPVLAGECLMQRDVEGALRLTQLAQWLRSDDGRVWLVSASANLMAGRTQEALDHLQKVLRIYPNHPGSHLLLTWVYITSRSLDEALPAAQRAIEANPTFAESHGTLAVIHALRGERDAAEKNIRRATLLDKNSFAARYAQSILEGNPPGRVDELFREVMRSFGR